MSAALLLTYAALRRHMRRRPAAYRLRVRRTFVHTARLYGLSMARQATELAELLAEETD